jgi:hypothetical protein
VADRVSLGSRHQAFLARYGGVALGLRLLDLAADHVEGLVAPAWAAVNLEDLRARDLPRDMTLEARSFATLEGRYVAFKYSGLRESFSRHVSRGANSSMRGPGPFIAERSQTIDIIREGAWAAPEGTCAIVLQEMVTSAPPFNDVIVHATGDRVVIEARDDTNVAVFDWTHERAWLETKDGSAALGSLKQEFETLVEMHRKLSLKLGFPVNTEGFWNDGSFVAIQLRPIPTDVPTDSSLTPKVLEMAARPDTFLTHFVHGAYDIQGTVARDPSDAGRSIGLFLTPPRSADSSDLARHSRLARYGELRSQRPLRKSLWLSRANVDAQISGVPFVILDALDAFHLSHDIDYLPPAGLLRERLNYAACGPIADAIDDGAEIRIMSDGSFAAICQQP